MATPEQTSANSTGWSLKKLPTISVRTPSQSPRRVTSARRVFYHMTPPGAPFQLRRPLRQWPPGGRARVATVSGQARDPVSALALGGVRVRELEVRGYLLEVPHEL